MLGGIAPLPALILNGYNNYDMATLQRTEYDSLAPANSRSWLPLLALGAAVGLGLAGGLAVTLGNPLIPFAAITGLLTLAVLLSSAERLVVGAALIAVLLPFAVVPVKLVITPAFLEVSELLLIAVWLGQLLKGKPLNVSPVHAPLLLFIGLSLFAFILGIARDFSADIAHNYFRMALGFVLFYAVTTLVDGPMLRRLVRWLVVAGGLAAIIGIGLWAVGDRAESILLKLAVVGYPTTDVIRHLEANPALAVRATGTSVDPNSFAGMLVLVFVLALAQALAKREESVGLPRWISWGTVAASGAALILTQSRSAWLGAAAAAGIIALLRYRRLFVYGAAGAVTVLGLGLGSGYLSRLLAGFALQDPATLMRLNEYANAFAIIQKYPWFGVGFGTAGGFELDLTTGVSSVYLTIAERMGLIGLAGFGFVMFSFFAYVLPRVRQTPAAHPLPSSPIGGGARLSHLPSGWTGGGPVRRDSHPSPTLPYDRGGGNSALSTQHSALSTTLLGLMAAVAGALVVGVLDHYFFNIEFPHMAMLFWLFAALAVVAARLIDEQAAGEKEQANGTGH